MGIVYIDFETASLVDLNECGGARYSADPSTRIICTGYALDLEPVIIQEDGFMPDIFEEYIEKGHIFCAHNAMFELMIWNRFWGKAPKFKCTMAKASSCGAPRSLERAAKALQLGFEKDINGTRLINKFSKPNRHGGFDLPKDFTADAREFYEYCRKDIEVTRAIDERLPDISEDEQKIYELTTKINLRGLAIDLEFTRAAEFIADGLGVKAVKRLAELTDGTILSISQVERIKNYLNTNFNLTLPDLTADTLEGLKDVVMPEKAREIINIRMQNSLSSVKKFHRINESAQDGRVKDFLVYHGALTGRWSSKTVQFQNLPKGNSSETAVSLVKSRDVDAFAMLYDSPMTTISDLIRGAIVAPEGKKLLVADYASIEARVVLWLAGQKDAVQLLETGQDIYIDMAKKIFRNPNLTKADTQARQLGKRAILGAGYGMGPDKFKATCEKYGIMVNDDLAKQAIYSYRNSYTHVPALWAALERAAMGAMQKPHYRFTVLNKVSYVYHAPFLFCYLPSGRRLCYGMPVLEARGGTWGDALSLFYFTVDSQTQNFKKTNTYGGKLTENVVQALARDIMAGAMLTLEANNYPVVLSVHDEIICEVPDTNDFTIEEMIKTMVVLPPWAEGCPIGAEGWEGKRYKK